MKVIKDIKYSNYPECLLDIYLPDSDEFSVFVYFHGGGLVSRDKSDAKVLAEYLTQHNVAVVSADYRMYWDAKFPDFLEDAAACVSWVFANMKDYGNCEKVYVGGSSAGGYISMMLCFDKKYLSAHGLLPTDIAGYIHDAGQPTSHFNVLCEQKIDPRRVIIDETAPIYHVGTEESYSNMVFIISDNDMEGRFEQTMLMEATLKHFGHSVDMKHMHGSHCEYVEKIDDEGNSILGEIIYSHIEKWRNI